MLSILANRIKSGASNQKNLFDSVVGQINTLEKRWIVDIDTKDEKTLEEIKKFIYYLEPMKFIDSSTGEIEDKVETTIPTKNVFHLITSKFNVLEFKKKYPELDIQKKNPTLLYYPNSLN
jgi:hypothetical protein